MKNVFFSMVIVATAVALGALVTETTLVARAPTPLVAVHFEPIAADLADHIATPTAAEQAEASSPSGRGECREYRLGSGCGVLSGSVGCHTEAQAEVYNHRCRETSSWGKRCKCK